MRILINASILDGRPSGLGIYTREVAQRIERLLPQTAILTSQPTLFRNGLKIVAPARGMKGHLFRLLWTQTVLPYHCQRLKADLLFNTLPEGPWLGRCPQVTVLHDVLPLQFEKEYPRQQYYFKHLVPKALSRSARVITDSQATRDAAMRFYGLPAEKFRVSPGGYDSALFHPPGSHKEKEAAAQVKSRRGLASYIFYAGSLLPHKNVSGLLKAFSASRISQSLVIAGEKDPRYFPTLRDEARQLGIEKKVCFLGYVPCEELPLLYGACDAFVFLSRGEGFGLPVLEAMACGAPVVASEIPSLKEIAGENALWVHPDAPSHAAQSLRRLLKNPPLRRRLSACGMKCARRFSWEKTAEAILSVFREILEK